MLFRLRLLTTILLLFQMTLGPTLAIACTGITIRPKDGSVIFARTLEFAIDLKSNIIIIPRGQSYTGTAPGNQQGRRWSTKYGTVGVNAFDLPVIIDGLNERGLHVGLFYFPGFAKYQEVPADALDRTVAPWELPTYLLGTCANVKETVAAVKNIVVGAAIQPQMGIVPPVHLIVTDVSGSSVVLEYVAGELRIHDNPLGVLTNSPTFDWHMTNLGNYLTVTPQNIEKLDLGGNEIKSLGQGSGMLGLPGDFTPPSRFVRAVAFSKTALPVDKAEDGVLQAFHILNQFDIPKGSARGLEQGQAVADYTLWTISADLKNLRYYFRTFENSRIRMVDLKSIDFGARQMKTISMRGPEQIEDVTGRAK